jgi:hypothetical protein
MTLVLLFGCPVAGSCEVTDIRIYTPPIVVGDVVAYEAVDDNEHPVESYVWDYRFIGSCTGPWTGNIQTDGPLIDFIEPFAGTHEIRLRVTYQATSGGQHPPTEIIKTVSVAQMDGFRIESGLNTPTPHGPSDRLHMQFVITCGGEDAGWYVPGSVYENITNKVFLGVPQQNLGWTGSQDGVFYKEGNVIHDFKGTDIPNYWDSINVGSVFYTFTQEMKIVYIDPCGVEVTVHLGSVNLKRKKVSNGEWQIEQ